VTAAGWKTAAGISDPALDIINNMIINISLNDGRVRMGNPSHLRVVGQTLSAE
jgi:hypothetical protein